MPSDPRQDGDTKPDLRVPALAALREALRDGMQDFQDKTYLDEANHRYHCGGSEAGRLMEYLVPRLSGWTLVSDAELERLRAALERLVEHRDALANATAHRLTCECSGTDDGEHSCATFQTAWRQARAALADRSQTTAPESSNAK